MRLDVEWAVRNFLVGLEELGCYPHCGPSHKLVRRKGWAFQLKPRSKFIFKPKPKPCLVSDRKEVGLGSSAPDPQPSFGLLKKTQEEGLFLPL